MRCAPTCPCASPRRLGDLSPPDRVDSDARKLTGKPPPAPTPFYSMCYHLHNTIRSSLKMSASRDGLCWGHARLAVEDLHLVLCLAVLVRREIITTPHCRCKANYGHQVANYCIFRAFCKRLAYLAGKVKLANRVGRHSSCFQPALLALRIMGVLRLFWSSLWTYTW